MKSFFTYAQMKNIVSLIVEGYGRGIPADSDQESDGDGESGEGEDGEPGEDQPGQGKPGKDKSGKDKQPSEWGEPDDMIDPSKRPPRALDGSDTPNDEDTDQESTSDIIKRAVKAQQGTGKGKLSDLDEKLEALGVKQLDWKTVVTDMLSSFIVPSSYAYQKMERDAFVRASQGMGRMPGEIEDEDMQLGNIMVALDTSGSMTKDMLSKFCSSIEQIARQREIISGLGIIRIVYYADQAWGYQDFFPQDRASSIKTVVLGTANKKSGGNDWPKVMEDIFSAPNSLPELSGKVNPQSRMVRNDMFDGYIFLTDGGEFGTFQGTYATVPSKLSKKRPQAPFVLCLTEGGTSWNMNFLEFVKRSDTTCQIIDIV